MKLIGVNTDLWHAKRLVEILREEVSELKYRISASSTRTHLRGTNYRFREISPTLIRHHLNEVIVSKLTLIFPAQG